MVVTHWAAKYIGIPFADLGFDETGCHCWGLVCLVYQRELGITLPRYDLWTAKQLLEAARAFKRDHDLPPWNAVGARKDFDVVLMNARGVMRHAGVAVGPDRVLHVRQGIRTTCVPQDNYSVAGSIAAARRHDLLMGRE